MKINDYKFKYGMAKIVSDCVGGLVIDFPSGTSMIAKEDVIALARHFKLTVNDITEVNSQPTHDREQIK